jgi:hypothetical protein
MKKLSLFILPLMFAAMLTGCEYFFPDTGSDDQPIENTIKLNEEFDLKYGQVVMLDEGNVKFHFSSVAEDSRCPERVHCVWEGNAMIIVDGYATDGQSGSLMLNTFKGNASRYPNKGTFAGYEVELISLKPYPVSEKQIPHSDYVARLIVRK